jgi:hypothetical protein
MLLIEQCKKNGTTTRNFLSDIVMRPNKLDLLNASSTLTPFLQVRFDDHAIRQFCNETVNLYRKQWQIARCTTKAGFSYKQY